MAKYLKQCRNLFTPYTVAMVIVTVHQFKGEVLVLLMLLTFTHLADQHGRKTSY